MKRLYMYITGLLTLMGCISDYEPDIVNQIGGLLVVDGFITNDTTRIRLSHSVRMLDEFEEGESITDANVFVESDKGAVFETLNVSKDGVYTIPMGELNPAYKYRLSINWNNKEYKSEYLNPLDTPVIDSISVESSASETPVYICVTTHDNKVEPTYYKWTYHRRYENSCRSICKRWFFR